MRYSTFKTLVFAAMLGSTATIIGCRSNGEATDQPATAPGDSAQPVVILEGVSGNAPALTDLGVMLIKTQAQYDALGDANIFPGGLDFDQYDLIIVALGEQTTGGYSVEITSIQTEGDTLLVNGSTQRPGEGDVVTTALTYPYDAVVIAKTSATAVEPHID